MSDECPYDDDGSCPLDWKTCSIAMDKSDETYAENCPKDEIGPYKAEIESLQAEISEWKGHLADHCEVYKHDVGELEAEIKRIKSLGMDALDFYIKATEMRHRNMMNVCDMALEAIDYAEGLEQQLAKQQAYIGRLESRFLELSEADLWDSTYNADGATAHIVRNKRAAKEALEKLKG